MLRRTPLVRGKSLRRSEQPLRRTPIRARSKRTAALYRGARGALNRELEESPRACEVCPRLEAAGVLVRCGGRATAWHELRKRSANGSIVNRANVTPTCTFGNEAVETFPIQARQAGLVVREGDPQWEALSRAHDDAHRGS